MIRNATREDLPALVELGRQMAAESPRYSRLRYSACKVEALLGKMIDSPDGFVMLAEADGVAVGVMAAFVSAHWMSDDLMASDFGLYMLPEHRGGTAAMRMARAYIAWARARGALDISLGISTNVNSEQTARFYSALGGRPAGFLFLFEAPHV
jgi:GNAT superfamily N-acetyltransferase